MARSLIKIDRVAEKLVTTEPAVRWLRHTGALPPAAKIGGRLLWDEAEIDQYIEAAFAEAS